MSTEQKQGLGLAVAKSGEMAASAVASKAKALVEAKYVIAMQRPRSIMDARAAILDACRRPHFAKSALYSKPVAGKQMEGLSIRFAETAIQSMRTVNITVTDLEANLAYSKDVTIAKTVERKKLSGGQVAISERLNTYNEKVYLVAATEDEIANKIAAQESKVIRNCGLRLIPQDILEEAWEVITETLNNGGEDTSAETKKVADAFTSLNIRPGELERYLGHTLATVSKKELNNLRAIFQTVRDGESSWADYVKEKEASEAAKPIFAEKKEDNSNADLAPAKGETKKVEKPARVESVKTPEKTTEPAKPTAEQTPETPTQAVRGMLESAGVVFEDFRDLLHTQGDIRCEREELPEHFPNWEAIPEAVYTAFAGDAKKVAKCIKLYGKKGNS
jgi:hypothetical protein